MLAFSSTTFPNMSNGWSFEEPLSSQDGQKNTKITTTPQSQTDQTNELLFEGLPRIDNAIDFPSSHHQLYYSKESHEFDVELGAERSLMVKKLNHNASERNRRKKMNFLYSTLRSLLPPAAGNHQHQKKNLSFPATVCYVQEYIPELKKEIERLSKTKDLLLSTISKKSNPLVQIDHNYQSGTSTTSISASPLCNGQVLVQISTTQENDFPISEAFGSLEEDHGLILLNASSFKSFGDKIFHSLHFQMQGPTEMEIQILKTKLLVMYEKKNHTSFNLDVQYF
ncbi:hypothetical protein HAX54_002877 [Datura stramonium]|uniref:BHLH domain-containing protein n=1 Tax=Datura stramonium TaxID=4076 RepID=A0ABS8WVJ7_DATST|nr:hypothetical protein [Datura stramonium]